MEFAIETKDTDMIHHSFYCFQNLFERRATQLFFDLGQNVYPRTDNKLTKMVCVAMSMIVHKLRFNYQCPQMSMNSRLFKLSRRDDGDLVITADSETIRVHSFLMKATSGYYESMCSFQSEDVKQMDLTGIVDEDSLFRLRVLLYNVTISKIWNLSVVIEMLRVVDFLCCPSLIKRLSDEVVRRLTINNLPEVIHAWKKYFHHIDVIRECCSVLLCNSKEDPNYHRAKQADQLCV
jgi:hypothetical protein